jgi:predicted SAM-dependent methyltransferase
MRLNLGCGHEVLDGWENYDSHPVTDEVQYINLNTLPLPFETGSIDEVLLSHVLEHLEVNPYEFMMEIYRILKKDGVVQVKLPVFYNCITHTRFYHAPGYFAEITTRGKDASEEYVSDFFRVVSFKKKSLGLKHGLGKLIAFVMDLFFDEYSWVLIKK